MYIRILGLYEVKTRNMNGFTFKSQVKSSFQGIKSQVLIFVISDSPSLKSSALQQNRDKNKPLCQMYNT